MSKRFGRGAAALSLSLVFTIGGCGGDGGGNDQILQATLTAIAITPLNPQLAKGTVEQMMATGTYSDNTSRDITTTVTWRSSLESVATVSNDGLATAVDVGSTIISASYGNVTGSTTMTVTSARLLSIEITPISPHIAKGTTKQFVATGGFSDGTTQDLTLQVTWGSSNIAVAAIGSNGVATAIHIGATTISAEMGGVSSSVTLTVTPATLVSLAVEPEDSSISNGTAKQFTATGTYSDGTTQDLSSLVAWTSSNGAVAVVSNTSGSNGLIVSVAVGTAIITAIDISSGIADSALLTVTISLATGDATQVSDTTAILNGQFENVSQQTEAWFEYGTTVSYGHSTVHAAYAQNGITAISATISGLSQVTVYHFRMVIQNSEGIFYGDDKQFVTLRTPETLATGSVPVAVAVDSTDIYWIESGFVGSGAIKKTSINGGAVATLVDGLEQPLAIAVDTSNVYWIDGGYTGSIKKVGKNGGIVVTLASSLDQPNRDIDIDSDNVYWVDGGSIRKVSINGGSVTAIASGLYSFSAIAVDDTHVYWTEFDAIKKVAKNGGIVTTLATGGLRSPSETDIRISSTKVYWSEAGTGVGTVKVVDIIGGTVTNLADGLSYPSDIAVDAESVYWNGGWSGSISKISIGGGPITTLAAGLYTPTAVAIDSQYIYWGEYSSETGNGFVRRTLKSY